MDGKYFLGGIGVIALAMIEITALVVGKIDGAILSSVVGAVCTLIGTVIGIGYAGKNPPTAG